MRLHYLLGALCCCGFALTSCCASPRIPLTTPDAPRGAVQVTNFDAMSVGAAPAGFRCSAPGPSNAKPARWEVQTVSDAPSASNVLVQNDGDEANNRFPIALVDSVSLADVAVSVHARAVSGARDRSFGVVVRAVDDTNYYVARANTSTWGENIRFYKFVNGKRTELDEWEGAVPPGVWHQLEVIALGSTFTVKLNGTPVISVQDTTFSASGLAGVWTKAESISQFDNLTITPLTVETVK